MVRHIIFLSSAYKQKKRIAYDIADGSVEAAKSLLNAIAETCGPRVNVSTHYIWAKTEEWESVVEADPFFEDVLWIRSSERFLRIIQEDRVLSGMDVARMILSKAPCTHLQLEKLVYLCFAEYLCRTGKLLFPNPIYAFRYGPVVDDVYDAYRRYKDEEISEEIHPGAARSRILSGEDGAEKLACIEQCMEQYGRLSAKELVDLTHRPGSPWSVSFDGKYYTEIPTSVIAQHHCAERISQ